MYYPNLVSPSLEKPNKLLFAIYASAVMMNLLKKQRDAVGLSIYADKLEVHTPNRTTQRHHKILYHELDKLLQVDAVKSAKQTESTVALHQVSELLHKRSLVMIFTDFIHSTKTLEEQFKAYKHLKYNKHEIVLFYLSEPTTEKDLEFDNKPYKFVDLETGEEIKLSPNLYQKKHKEQAENYLKELKLKCLQYKIDFVEIDINKGFDKVLNSYLLKRQKML